jgi:hypothetical protein
MFREGPMYDKLARIFIDCVREQGGWYILFSIYHVVFFCPKSFIILLNRVIARFEHCVLNWVSFLVRFYMHGFCGFLE